MMEMSENDKMEMNENEKMEMNENEKMEMKLMMNVKPEKGLVIKGGEHRFKVVDADDNSGKWTYGTKYDVDEIIDKIVSFSDKFYIPEGSSITKEDILKFLYKLKDKNTTWTVDYDGLRFFGKKFKYSLKDSPIKHDGMFLLSLSYLDDDVLNVMSLNFYDCDQRGVDIFYIFYSPFTSTYETLMS